MRITTTLPGLANMIVHSYRVRAGEYIVSSIGYHPDTTKFTFTATKAREGLNLTSTSGCYIVTSIPAAYVPEDGVWEDEGSALP